MLDWKSIQEKAGGNFKRYYADGRYKTKCDGVEIKEVGSNGSVIMKFHFEDGEKAEIIQESKIDSIIPKGTQIYLGIKTEKINVFSEDGSRNLVTGVVNDNDVYTK